MRKHYLKISVLIVSVIVLVVLTSCGKIGIPACNPTLFLDWMDSQGEATPALSESDTKKSTEGDNTEESEIPSEIIGEKVDCQHHYVETIIKNASCLEDGLTEKKCNLCGNTIQLVIGALGHTEVIDAYVVPTCLEDGLTEGKHCSACNEILVAQTAISAKGHVEVIDSYVAPTCAKSGLTEGKHCSTCGKVSIKQNVIPALPHTEVADAYVEPTCTTTGLTAGKHCSVCKNVIVKQTVIPAPGHTEVIDAYVASTCTETGLTQGKHCSVCKKTLVKQTVIAAKGHTEVIDAYVAPSCTTDGLSEGKHCFACGKVFIAQKKLEKRHAFSLWRLTEAPTDDELGKETRNCILCNAKETRSVTWDTVDWTFVNVYNSRYGYEFLGTLENGDKFQALYNEIDKEVRKFHFDTSINVTKSASGNYVVAEIDYKKFGLTTLDYAAEKVMSVYYYDNPLYYWLLNGFTSGVGKFGIVTDKEFALGFTRAQYNLSTFNGIDKHSKLVYGKTSAYEVALTYHDAITGAVNYAYKADGTTPEDAQWAHSILGVFENRGAVCSAYAKTFQLLLNVSGIDNIFVRGKSGRENHVWNIVKLDDGKWYWCDLTWDDSSNSYRYFCVGDTTTFLSQHVYGNPNVNFLDYGVIYLYSLPERAKSNYKHS